MGGIFLKTTNANYSATAMVQYVKTHATLLESQSGGRVWEEKLASQACAPSLQIGLKEKDVLIIFFFNDATKYIYTVKVTIRK